MSANILFVVIFLANSYHYAASHADFTYTLDDGYPIGKKLFGNIAGVDVDKENNVIIFHRGSHRWDDSTFDENDNYLPRHNSPITEETVITINPKEKKIISAWGRNLFFMPHGLSLDLQGKNVWLTDVALHQVFKYPINGSQELLALGTAFIPGNDDAHFCKPTSVADTGEFIFVADGYCNSRIAMFSSEGKYLGEFGQSTEASFIPNTPNIQPTFRIPHKITYSKDAGRLYVADRENGRIQCFSFEPKHDRLTSRESGMILNGAIKLEYIIADPAFNGRLFSLDYSPVAGGIIVAVSGESLYSSNKPPIGFVYNATYGQFISRFSPPVGQTFGMAHDLALTENGAEFLYVVDITPVNLWRFSRPVEHRQVSRTVEITQMAGRAISVIREKEHDFGIIWYVFLFSIAVTLLIFIAKTRRVNRHSSSNSFASLYSNSYPNSFHSLFGNNRFQRRPGSNGSRALFSTMFSRRAFFNLFDGVNQQQQQNDFSRIPLEESDNSDNDKSDSDVEEFNISQATPSIKIDV